MSGDPIDDEWTVRTFCQSDRAGEGHGDAPSLLRRVADSIENLGDVDVQDIVVHAEVTGEEDDLTMTVYYQRQLRRR